ncbi:hypothetical protein GCM10009754_19840 [Amycolatopsis minnesotensis]|uniref:Nudix hydrolase domain-containing protein n=1 Tax=Amycolatopsis minnesotensis TaxID=337894 RepID=A0ABP5BU13_9PSEU
MVDKHGSWETFAERLVYDNRWVKVGLTDVQAPNGERWEYHVVHLARIAIALIVNERDEALMLWRYRFATKQWGYELLGGMVDDGEEAAQTAAREAAEESGWRLVGEPEHLVSFEPLPGRSPRRWTCTCGGRLSTSASRPIRRRSGAWSGCRCRG